MLSQSPAAIKDVLFIGNNPFVNDGKLSLDEVRSNSDKKVDELEISIDNEENEKKKGIGLDISQT